MCMFLAIVVEAEHDTRYPIFRINSLLSSDVYIKRKHRQIKEFYVVS